MFIFSINPCSSIIKSSIKTARNNCPTGQLAFLLTDTLCCKRKKKNYLAVLGHICNISFLHDGPLPWFQDHASNMPPGPYSTSMLSAATVNFILPVLFVECTQANSFPRWKRCVQQETHVSYLPPVVFTFQQIALCVLVCVPLDFLRFVRLQCLHQNTKSQIAVT